MVGNGRGGSPLLLQGYSAAGQQAAALIAATPVVPKEVFCRLAQPCDIILTKAPRRSGEPWFSRFWLQLSGLAQDCPYCSAKIYLDHNLIAGYGFRRRWDRPLFRGVAYQRFIALLDDALLLRVPGLTSRQRQRIDQYVREQLGAPFHLGWVIRSFLQRRLGGRPHWKNPSLAEPAGRNGSVPLSCSTIIAFPFFREGIALAPSPSMAWPIDFLLSPLTHKVCRLGGSEAGRR